MNLGRDDGACGCAFTPTCPRKHRHVIPLPLLPHHLCVLRPFPQVTPTSSWTSFVAAARPPSPAPAALPRMSSSQLSPRSEEFRRVEYVRNFCRSHCLPLEHALTPSSRLVCSCSSSRCARLGIFMMCLHGFLPRRSRPRGFRSAREACRSFTPGFL